MTSLLRQLVAGPRARHPTSKLDLCYVTPQLIVTSGPAQTYPSRAYRNPLPRLIAFIEGRHGRAGWRIFEFRAEGTGYTDDEVRGNIEHFPWPDHHPPPFGVLPDVVRAMEAWLGDVTMEMPEKPEREGEGAQQQLQQQGSGDGQLEEQEWEKEGRVAVLHCKAGKGRSGTVACSYLIAAQGWEMERALARFSSRRMRPGWGLGVSIKSQRRWVGYVTRWAKHGRRYEETLDGRPVQVRVMEVRIWGMRDNTRVAIRGFTEGGKKIENFHEWSDQDAEILPLDEDDATLRSWLMKSEESPPLSGTSTPKSGKMGTAINSIRDGFKSPPSLKSPSSGSSGNTASSYFANPPPPTLSILRPKKPIVLPTLDVNIEVEKRNRNFTSMVTSTAHSWFNAYFEGNGPENDGKPESSGIYSVEWDAMDGLKGSSKRGVRAVEKVAVVWKMVGEDEAAQAEVARKVQEEQEEEQKTVTEKATEKLQETQHKELNKKLGEDSDSDDEGVQTYGVDDEGHPEK